MPTRFVSPALFACIVLAFALPFATVSCNGGPVRTTGLELATWQVPDGHPHATTDDGSSLADAVEARESLLALGTLAISVLGFGLGVRFRRLEGFASSVGLIFVMLMWWQSFEVFGPDVHYESGFLIVSVGYLVLALWHGARAMRRWWRRRRLNHPRGETPGLPTRGGDRRVPARAAAS